MTSRATRPVPKAAAAEYDAVVALTDCFCAEHLTEEYAELGRRAVAALARKRPSPLKSGSARTWACAVLYAIGRANFLDDKATKPYMKMADLCALFGVATSTGGNKAKLIRDMLSIDIFTAEWILPSEIANRPIAWMIMVNGFVVDARKMPVEVQEVAVAKGLIPHVVPPIDKAAA